MKKRIAAATLLLLASLALRAAEISPAGKELSRQLDAMDVEHHWIAGSHVDWRTGDPDSGKPGKTHCSAFVAAFCDKKDVYILRPPEHGQVHLATAQVDWLGSEGRKSGWAPVESPFEAQRLANSGRIVVVGWPSPDREKSGHIAIVRPSGKSETRIREEGPEIIQAGGHNAQSTSVKEGFRQHRGAWSSAARHDVLFFVYEGHTGSQ